MNTRTHLILSREVDETLFAMIGKAKTVDRFAAHDAEDAITATLHDRWDTRVNQAMHMIAMNTYPTLGHTTYVLDSYLRGSSITFGLGAQMQPHIADGFNRGRASVNAMYTKQTGREVMQKDMNGNVMFGQVFGLTEDHALQALQDQLTVAAGGFWDDRLSASIKKELEQFFSSDETKDQLIDNIRKLVNTRLLTTGQDALARSYFDNLATNQIVRARNVGSYYRAKSLSAKHYTLINPHDGRTSPVCLAVTNGQIYTMAGAEETVSGILTASSVSDLKSVAPFYKAGDAVTNPVPPLHWPKCRTWMNFVF